MVCRLILRGISNVSDNICKENQNTHFFKIFYLPTDVQENCFKKNIKIYIKQLLHVLVQSPSSGSTLSLLNLQLLK